MHDRVYEIEQEPPPPAAPLSHHQWRRDRDEQRETAGLTSNLSELETAIKSAKQLLVQLQVTRTIVQIGGNL